MEVRRTAAFADWLASLRDQNAKGRIVSRISRLEFGNPGDTKSVGGGVSEMRIDYGPGYRVYYAARGAALVILLCGGDKRTQDADIRRAKSMAKEL
ncbi:MAG TPA: type II toxin-antitoxin system RelE/ParE family toxin [Xanthobacteraceae bacterium]|nr:type II toxin-antitoxin system RelE/ParE family toxin [Xanthobacteraceae bacterium]